MNNTTENSCLYNDIINLPHHISTSHPQMSIADRAAQFAPFAALTGYDDEVKEKARITDEKIELSESDQELLNEKFEVLSNCISSMPSITVTYFIADKKKTGGKYVKMNNNVRKIDLYNRVLVMADGEIVPIDDIFDLSGEIFVNLEE